MPKKVFLSYRFADESYVRQVNYHLKKQPHFETYCWGDEARAGPFQEQLATALEDAEGFVLFVGEAMGDYQTDEAKEAQRRSAQCELVLVKLTEASQVPGALLKFRNCPAILATTSSLDCARQIAQLLLDKSRGEQWIADDDLPIGYPFDYEKSIIEVYAKGRGQLNDPNLLEQGCPQHWPTVEKSSARVPNPLDPKVIGTWRSAEQQVVVDARVQYAVADDATAQTSDVHAQPLTFLEARPREFLGHPINSDELTVGIVVSGGIAPGINAVIAGIVERHELYRNAFVRKEGARGRPHRLKICGFRDGLAGLLSGGHHNYESLHLVGARERANFGGAMFGTSRAEGLLSHEPEKREALLKVIIQNLQAAGVEILYMIGGDGSMRAAHALSCKARQLKQEHRKEISIVAIPKTMDNDILWCWQSFGFLSAVEEAKEAIVKLHTEVRSNPRVCVIQLFGSDSGFVVSHAAVGSGVCDAALVPEVPFSMAKLSSYMRDKLAERDVPGSSPYGLIVMAEAALPTDAKDFLTKKNDIGLSKDEKAAVLAYERNGRRVHGQTPDELRSAGLKLVSRVLQRDIRAMPSERFNKYRVFTNEPRQLIRAITPSVADVIFAQRLGSLAVDNAMAGYSDFMVSQWLTEYVLVPLKLVVLGRKRLPPEGIFWKSVLSSTGQRDLK